VSLDLDRAIPAGLIISELVSNAFKHAFPLQAEGEILVELHEEEDRLVLRVSDNGIGFPSGTAPQGEETLGLLLVRNLCRQLEGRVSITGSRGTVCEIVFPAQPT
jgi:two-component sensor histidine kinase